MKKLLLLALLIASNAFALPQTDRQFIDASSQQLLENPGFENGTSGYTASSPATMTKLTGANALAGLTSMRFTPTAGSQTIQSKLYTVPPGLYGSPCILYGTKRTAEATNRVTARVLDGSANLLASTIITTSSVVSPYISAEPFAVPFQCPSSGTFRLELLSSGSAVANDFDSLTLGKDIRLSQSSQARFYGSITYPATALCSWDIGQTTYASDFSLDSDCTTPVGGNVKGSAAAPATKIPAVQLDNAPAGTYFFVAHGMFAKNNNTANDISYFRFSDGTNTTPDQATQVGLTGTAVAAPVIAGTLTYTTPGSRTVRIQAHSTTAVLASVSATTNDFTIDVFYYPAVVDQSMRIDQMAWKVDANIGGANPSLGTASVSTYSPIENGSLDLVNNPGSGNIAAQIPCSSTNAPTGLTCSSGNESVGISFVLPQAGDVLACASATHSMANGAAGVLEGGFEIVETPNNAQTILQESNDRANTGNISANITQAMPMHTCGVLRFSSAGQKTLRLFYEQGVTGTVTASLIAGDRSGTVGQRDIHWLVLPLTYVSGALPAFSGLITNSGAGQYKMEVAQLNCDGSSVITSQLGNWVSSIGNISAGNCIVTLLAGAFSTAPYCVANWSDTSSTGVFMNATSTSATSVTIRLVNWNGSAIVQSTGGDGSLMCFGLK